jgi:hypothetical protein
MRAIYYTFGTTLVAKRAGITMHYRRGYAVHLWGSPRWTRIGPTYIEAYNRLVRLLKRSVEQ